MEAIIPTEIGVPTLRTKIPKKANANVVNKDLDMTDKLRKATTVRITSYQQRMTKLYNRHAKLRAFQAGDLFLRRVFETQLTQWLANSNQIGRGHT